MPPTPQTRHYLALALVVGLTFAVPTVQANDAALIIDFAKDSGQVAGCVIEGVDPANDGDGSLQLRMRQGQNAPSGAPEAFEIKQGAVSLLQVAKGAPAMSLVATDLTQLSVVGSDTLECEIQAPPLQLDPGPGAPTVKTGKRAPVDSPQLAEMVAEARKYLVAQSIIDHGRSGDHVTLYHLPDGRPAFPLPTHLAESADIALAAVIPDGAQASFQVTSCDARPGYRIAGSFSGASEVLGRLQSAERPQRTYHIAQHDSLLRCAGTLSYEVQIDFDEGAPEVKQSLSIVLDPVYRFSWGVALGFDFGSPTQLSLGDRNDGSGGSEKFISELDDMTGLQPFVSLTVFLFEANPRDWHLTNVFFNPFVALDPLRLTEGFVVGLNIKPFFEVGVLLGLSVFQVEQLKDGVSSEPGDTWTAAGDLPTDKVFSKDSLGLLVGVELPVEVLTALVK